MIDILRKLLEDAKEDELHDYLLLYKKIEDIKDNLEDLTFESKESTFSEIMSLLELYKIYYIFPDIVEKNILGISSFDFKIKSKFYKDILKIRKTKPLRLFCDKLILSSENDNLTFLNYLDKKLPVTNKEINFLSENRKINLKEIINVLRTDYSELDYKDIVFFDMLEETFFDSTNLFKIDSLIILSNNQNEIEKKLNYLNRNKFAGIIRVYSEYDIEKFSTKYPLNIEMFDDLEELMTLISSSKEVYNKIQDIVIKIKLVFERAFLNLKEVKEKLIARKNNIEKILIFEKDKKLIELSLEYKEKIDLNNTSNKKLQELYINTLNIIEKLMKSSKENLANPKLKYEMGKVLIKSGKNTELEKIILDLDHQKFHKTIFLKYLDERKPEKYKKIVLELDNKNDIELLLEQIKISYQQSKYTNIVKVNLKIINSIPLDDFTDSEACEVLGELLIDIDYQKSIIFFRKGLDLGNIRCGSKLFYIYKGNNDLSNNLTYLSKNNVQEACIKLGYDYLEEGEHGKAVFEFKKGAILGSDECFYKLGDIHDKNSSLALFFFYQIKDREKYWDNIVKERITKSFYYSKSVEELNSFYRESKFPLAAFFLGKIYEKGEIVEKDENRALEFYKNSKSLPQGLKNYTRLNNYITRRNNRSYSSSYSSNYSGSYSKKSNSFCFITTAVCNTLGKEDDCIELNTFRKFRDNWLMLQAEGKKDIEEYYRIAPSIVSKINFLGNSKIIYKNIWNNYLTLCYDMINKGEFEEAWKIYKKMVIELIYTYKV